MAKLTILRGISGSGKSTWAKTQSAVVISRDTIRMGLFGEFTMHNEGLVSVVQDAAVRATLTEGKDVIVDNTNIEWKYVKALADIAYSVGAEVEVKVFDVPYGAAVNNVARRAATGGLSVPIEVIRKQHSRFQGNKNKTLDARQSVQPYVRDASKPTAVLVDIDGTLAHMHDRGPFDWKKVGNDHLDKNVAEITRIFENGVDHVIVMSGRDSSCREETVAWLDLHEIWYDALYMRAAGDMRKDNIVKYDLFNEHIRDNYDVLCVLDDRNQVVKMWRELGLTCLQVAEGDF